MKAAKPYESIHAIHVGKKLEVISFINCKEWIPKKYNGIKNRVVSDTSFIGTFMFIVVMVGSIHSCITKLKVKEIWYTEAKMLRDRRWE